VRFSTGKWLGWGTEGDSKKVFINTVAWIVIILISSVRACISEALDRIPCISSASDLLKTKKEVVSLVANLCSNRLASGNRTAHQRNTNSSGEMTTFI